MRKQMSLNGEWDFMPLYEQRFCRSLPEKLVYEACKIQVPSSWRSTYETAAGRVFGEIPEHGFCPLDVYGYPKEWNKAEAGVLHRSFRVPEAMAGQKIVFRLDGIMQQAAIYLDRHPVAVWEDGYLPLRLDIGAFVTPGREHHLHIVCGSFDQVTLPSGDKKVTGLTGSWFGYISRGIWQDVFLESYPPIAIEDLTLRTSYREQSLEAEVVVGSQTSGVVEEPLRLVLKVREKNKPDGAAVLMAEQQLNGTTFTAGENGRLCENELPGGLTGRAVFRLEWKDAKLWNPEQPFLYQAELTLYAGGTILDCKEESFGFRELWCDGPQFVLNGTPINLRGDSWHFQGAAQQTEAYVRSWYRMCKQAGVNSIRLHAEPYPEMYVRIADEEGMLIIDETAIYGSGKSMLADHPDYIANCRAHVRRLVQRDKNHPSVMMWSVQNEMRWVDGRDGYKLHIPGFMDIIRSLDPTRPIIVEGDNRLLPKEHTEVESRHYNIDGTIAQWDRSVPLTFGEHGGWWYICPQNSSMYVGLSAYRHTDEAARGLAEKERLFVEYARRQGVSGISTFNFAHYFMRAMPERNLPVTPGSPGDSGPKPKVTPAYSLTLHNGLLPEEYPAYRTNPSFEILSSVFQPAVIIAAEYNRAFFDDAPIHRSFDIYNDTLHTREVKVECRIEQGGQLVHAESFAFEQPPAGRRVIEVAWTPRAAECGDAAVLTAVLYHGEERIQELKLEYRLFPSRYKTEAVDLGRAAAFLGNDADYDVIAAMVPGCRRLGPEQILELDGETLLIIGSKQEDQDGRLEQALKQRVGAGGRLLLLEQRHLSIGKLPLVRRDFIRAHAGSYDHPVLRGLGDDDLMFWHPEVREEGPLPIIRAAFEKPVTGDFSMLLECSAGDFGDGGDLWSPLLEYRSGQGSFVASQLELMEHIRQVPQACLLLRNLLAYAGRTEPSAPAAKPAAAWVRSGGAADHFLNTLRLNADRVQGLSASALAGYGLLIVEAALLEAPEAAENLRRYVAEGGSCLLLPAESSDSPALSRLVGAPVSVIPHETYHLEADYRYDAVRGVSPVDLFGFDKVHLSPREVVNRSLAANSLEVPGAEVLCTSVEGTAWKDYFVGGHTAEYSRLALVELNRDKAREPGDYLLQLNVGAGCLLFSQLLPEVQSDKSIRLYTRLLGNLGASFDDGLLTGVKGDGEWAVEAVMALPCLPHMDAEAMKAYYTDPLFSLNNLGEGLYGWMKKKERNTADGLFRIPDPAGNLWFLSCFVLVEDEAAGNVYPAASHREGYLRILSRTPCEIYLNGLAVPEPEAGITLCPGVNRLMAIVQGGEEELRFGMVFMNPDGTYMNNLHYRMTMDEVEPK
ncbi:hypothetical protein GCM10010912_58830 [Paenibacillus albidus]|uniref:Beta-galactosidase n=1 Tax=Paenibacillus albidus TaxID=2041023 RepID=A0A917D1I0_9BACL|nr:glycoside hydrolase family 2 TIM barrel-domain containing protein [Paenibacillus albidus]GGG06453.1 hypothetical protein GCM10010912_58830 [Paenibacillus albidus]